MENTITLSITDVSTSNDISLYITTQEENKSLEFIFNRYTFLLPSRENVKFADFVLSQLRRDTEKKSIKLFEDSPNPDYDVFRLFDNNSTAELVVTGTVNAENEKVIMLTFKYWGRVGFCEIFIVNSEQAKEMVEFISLNLF